MLPYVNDYGSSDIDNFIFGSRVDISVDLNIYGMYTGGFYFDAINT